MTYSYKLYHSIQEINLHDWQQIVDQNKSKLFMDIHFLLTMEKSMNKFTKFWYLIFYDHNQVPHGCVALSTFKTDLTIFINNNIKVYLYLLRKRFPYFLYTNILFCGLPISLGQNHLIFVSEANQREIIELLNTFMEKLAIDEKASLIVYKEFDSSECKQLDILLNFGFSRADSLPMNHFAPTFVSFDDYYNSLRANYRKEVRKSRNKFKKAGLNLINIQDSEKILDIYTSEIHQFYEAIVNKSKTKLEILPITFFQELVINFPEQVCLTLAYDQNKIIGFMFSLYNESIFYCLFCGLDFQFNGESDLYFNLAYGTLEKALTFDLLDIEVGQTADVFKARLGCYQKPLYIYVKGVGFIFNWLVKRLFKFLFPKPLPVPLYKVFVSSREQT